MKLKALVAGAAIAALALLLGAWLVPSRPGDATRRCDGGFHADHLSPGVIIHIIHRGRTFDPGRPDHDGVRIPMIQYQMMAPGLQLCGWAGLGINAIDAPIQAEYTGFFFSTAIQLIHIASA